MKRWGGGICVWRMVLKEIQCKIKAGIKQFIVFGVQSVVPIYLTLNKMKQMSKI